MRTRQEINASIYRGELNKENMNTRRIGKVEGVRKTWLEKKEASAWLGGCSNDFLEKLAKESLVTVAKVSNKVFYEVDSLEKLMRSNVLIRQRLN